MQYTEIMVRYGELSTKGKNRQSFIDRLAHNTRQALRDFPRLEIKAHRDRMHIKLNGTDSKAVTARLDRIFGIQNYSPTVRVEKELTAAKQAAIALVKERFEPGMTFKVNTRRADHKFKYDTNQMNDFLGGAILEAVPGIKVRMKAPEILIRVEVRIDGIYLSLGKIKAAGGMPVGTAGKGMMMLSGGIDSPVAAYLAMKRGVEVEMVHFFSPPYTSEQALNKAKELTAKLTPYTGTIKFIEVPFTEIQETIKHSLPSGYLMTVQRRFMLRLTEKIAKQRHGLAIFNGEALGQVASQTLESMAAINDVTTMPVIRPVVSMDKTEIIELAQKIGTFDLSIQPFEDCCTIFAPPAPKTKPRIDRAREYEQRLDVDGLIDRALAGTKISTIHVGEQFLNQQQEEFADLL